MISLTGKSNDDGISWWIFLGAASAFALFGYDTGVVSTAMIWAKRDMGLSGVQYEMSVATTTGVAGLAALSARRTNADLGRKGTVLLASVAFFVGALFVCTCGNNANLGFAQLLFGRICIGIGCGLSTTTVPIYVAELAPSKMRATLVSMEIFFCVFGQTVAGALNALLATCSTPYWRLSMGLAILPAMCLAAVFYYLPESPRWLVAKEGNITAAAAALQSTRSPGANIHAEMERIIQDSKLSQKDMPLSAALWFGPDSSAGLRKSMAIGIAIMMLQQLAAINTIMYYSTIILIRVGFSEEAAAWLTCACAGMQGLGIACCVLYRLPDKYGRRPVLLISCTMVVVTLLGFAATFNTSPTAAVVFLFLYLFAFGLGLSPLPYALNSEFYPMRCRSACMAQATAANWETNFIVSLCVLHSLVFIITVYFRSTFITLLNSIGGFLSFVLYAACTAVGACLVYFAVPETKNVVLEDVSRNFDLDNASNSRRRLTAKFNYQHDVSILADEASPLVLAASDD